MSKWLSVLVLLFLGVGLSLADDNATTSDEKVLAPTNDVGLASDGTIQGMDSYEVRVGEFHAPGGEVYILPFRIPSLPAGQCIASIHFRAQMVALNNDGGGLANADFYYLGIRDTGKVLPSDYYQGAKPDPKATLIQANFLTPASEVRKHPDTGPFVQTSAEGNAALAKIFNEACANPANAGKSIFFRISYDLDTIPNGNNAYNLLTGGADGDYEPPVLLYTLGPVTKG